MKRPPENPVRERIRSALEAYGEAGTSAGFIAIDCDVSLLVVVSHLAALDRAGLAVRLPANRWRLKQPPTPVCA